jgi:hypothetical protein
MSSSPNDQLVAPPVAPPAGLISQPAAGTNSTPSVLPLMAAGAPSASTTSSTTGASNTGSASVGAAGTTPTAASYSPSQYQATGYTVDPNSTVASQINNIISSGSPLMQQATANAQAGMNARGLMNSSQAISAGEAGLLTAALPIAQQDSQSLVQAGFNTSTAANTASQTNSAAENAALQAYATQQNSLQQTAMNNESAVTIQNLQNQGNLANIQAQGVINTQLTNLQDTNKLILQTNAGASQLYSQALAYMANISTNPDLDPNQKATALNNSVSELSDALSVMTTTAGLPDVSSMLNFSIGGDQGMGQGNTTTPTGGTGNFNIPSSPVVNSAVNA